MVTEVAVDRDGGATVTLRVRWRVLAGRFRTFDLTDLPTDLGLLEASASDASGSPVAVATRIPGPGRLEVTLGEEGGLRRGAIDVMLRYTTSLRAQGAIRRVGPDAVLEFATVPWERGLEATEIRVALPASVRRAQWLADDTPGVDATVTSEVGRDVVHALRRHLPAHTRWNARIACDPTLFAWLDGPQRMTETSRQKTRRPHGTTAAFAAALAAAFGIAAAMISTRFGTRRLIRLPRALAQMPWILATMGGALQSLVFWSVRGAVSVGAAIAATGLFLALPGLRVPTTLDATQPARFWPEARMIATLRHSARVRWLVLGALGTTTIVSLIACAAFARQSVVMGVAAVDLGLIVLATLAAARPLEPSPDAVVLRPLAQRLSRRVGHSGAARTAWRVRGEGRAPGSVRLRVVPRPGYRFVRGVRAIECAVAWRAGALRWRATPVFIARAEAGSRLERTLRLLATRAGTIESAPEGNEVAWVADLAGPDRAAALAGLLRLVTEAITRSAPLATREHVVRDDFDGDQAEA